MLLQQEITKAIQTAARDIIADMGLQQIETRLLEIPAKIKEKQDQILSRQREIEDFKKQLEEQKGIAETIKAVTESEVILETNSDGKPRFSNDKLRNAEAAKRLAVNEEYQAARRAIQGLEEQIAAVNLDIGMLRSEVGQLEATMANYRVILSARAAQLAAIFGGQV